MGVYLSEDARVEARLFKELDSDLAGYDTGITSVGLSKQLSIETLLIWVEVEVGGRCMSCQYGVVGRLQGQRLARG